MAKGKIPNIAVTYNWLGSRVLGFKSRRQTLGENAEKNSERYLLSVWQNIIEFKWKCCKEVPAQQSDRRSWVPSRSRLSSESGRTCPRGCRSCCRGTLPTGQTPESNDKNMLRPESARVNGASLKSEIITKTVCPSLPFLSGLTILRKSYLRGRLGTFELLILSSFDQLLFILKTFLLFYETSYPNEVNCNKLFPLT